MAARINDLPPALTMQLRQLRSREAGAVERVVSLIYPVLQRLARAQLREERTGHVLQPTALVNEAYLRLVAQNEQNWQNRAHFFAAATEVMRRVLIDYARAQRTQKRKGDARPLFQTPVVGEDAVVDAMALDQALHDLEQRSSRQAEVVRLRYFGGLSVPEVAAVLQTTARTVDRDWAAARAFLRLRLTA